MTDLPVNSYMKIWIRWTRNGTLIPWDQFLKGHWIARHFIEEMEHIK